MSTTLFLGKAASVTAKIVTFASDATLNMTDSGVATTIASNNRVTTEVSTLNSTITSADASLTTRIATEETTARAAESNSVSYTHLTLPTICSV